MLRDTQSAAHIQGYITIYMRFSGRGPFDVIALVHIRPGDARQLGIISSKWQKKRKGCCVAFGLGGRFKLYIYDSTARQISLFLSAHRRVCIERDGQKNQKADDREREMEIYIRNAHTQETPRRPRDYLRENKNRIKDGRKEEEQQSFAEPWSSRLYFIKALLCWKLHRHLGSCVWVMQYTPASSLSAARSVSAHLFWFDLIILILR